MSGDVTESFNDCPELSGAIRSVATQLGKHAHRSCVVLDGVHPRQAALLSRVLQAHVHVVDCWVYDDRLMPCNWLLQSSGSVHRIRGTD